MNDLPDFRSWREIHRERARRDRAAALVWIVVVGLVAGFGIGVVLANKALPDAAHAAYAVRMHGADAIPMLGVVR